MTTDKEVLRSHIYRLNFEPITAGSSFFMIRRNVLPIRWQYSMICRNVLPIGFVIAAYMLLPFACPKQKPLQELCRVIRIDGDTIVIDCQGQQEKIRLLRINTPEKNQPGFSEATEAISFLIGGQAVRLEFEEPGRLERADTGAYWLMCG